jgi:O-6-methylguanine DNA methyltransferase
MSEDSKSKVAVRSCRFLNGAATVSWQGGKVVGVRLSTKSSGRPDSQLGRELLAVLKGRKIPESLHVDARRLPGFTRRVLGVCAAIPAGRVKTYAELAKQVGRPGAARAVGQVMSRNPFPLLIPCHRVVASGGRLCGFRGGLHWKQALLEHEGWTVRGTGADRRLAGRK